MSNGKCVPPTLLKSDFRMYTFILMLQFYASVVQNFLRKMIVASVFLENECWGQEGGWE